MKVKKQIRKGFLTAKLTFFDWGWADNVVYRITGKTNEKEKGLLMIQKIKEFFGVRNNEIEDSEVKRIKDEIKRIIWTRDEKGRIISPFDKKIKDEKKELEDG